MNILQILLIHKDPMKKPVPDDHVLKHISVTTFFYHLITLWKYLHGLN